MATVLVIDDHPIVLDSCKRLLLGAGAKSVSLAASISEGFRLYRELKPEVLVTDISVKSGVLDGVSFIRRLRIDDKGTPILVFSMHCDPTIISRAVEAGATGYLLKDAEPEEFLEAFQTVRQGRFYIKGDVASAVALAEADAMTNPMRTLTMRELHTLSRIAEGKPYGVIAEELHISYKAVANTASAIKTKLKARSLPDLMRIAIANLADERERRGVWAHCDESADP